MEEKTKKLLQWHTAFYAGIQIEPEPESENLIFENEHMLSRGYKLEKKQKGIYYVHGEKLARAYEGKKITSGIHRLWIF